MKLRTSVFLLFLGMGSCTYAMAEVGQQKREADWERLTTTTTQWYQQYESTPVKCPNSNAWRCYPQADGSLYKPPYRGNGAGEVIWPDDDFTPIPAH